MIVLGDTMKTCPACHGVGAFGERGLTFPGRTCEACRGTGQIAQVVHETEERPS